MGIYVGFDIGGTKCAAVTGVMQNGDIRILTREAFSTPADQLSAMERLCALAESMADGQPILGVGIWAGRWTRRRACCAIRPTYPAGAGFR